jgi:hypothetical protein
MRRVWRVLVWLAGLSLFLTAFVWWQWQQLLERSNIEDVHWELRRFNGNELHLSPLQFTYRQPEQALGVQVENVRLQWRWRGIKPQIDILDVNGAALTLTRANKIEAPDTASFALPETWALPQFLPRDIEINSLQMNFPCTTGRCTLSADVRGSFAENILTLSIKTLDTPKPVAVDLIYQVRIHDMQESAPRLRVTAMAEDLFEGKLDTRLDSAGPHNMAASDHQLWRGEFDLKMSPPNAEWQAYILRWYPVQTNQLSAINQPLQGSAEWAIAVAPLLAKSAAEQPLTLAEILHRLRTQLQGNVAIALDLPAPVPVPQIGSISGKANIALTGDAGQITHFAFDIEAALDSPVVPEALANFDIDFDSIRLIARSAAEQQLDTHDLPLQLQVETAGKVKLEFNTSLRLDGETFAFDITDGSLDVSAASWTPVENITLNNVVIQQQFAARWQDGIVTYSQREPGNVAADIASDIASIKGLKLNLEQLAFSGNPLLWRDSEILVRGAVNAVSIIHPQVLPQSWSWQGDVSAGNAKAQLNGTLVANDSLTVIHQLQLDPQHWQLEWQMPDIFLLAGNSLQELTPSWPPLLTLARGRIGADGNARGDFANASFAGQMNWRLADVTGIYDTTAFKGLKGLVDIKFTTDQINIGSEGLMVGEIAQGLTLGPLNVQGAYQAPLANLAKGKLDIASFQAALLGGQLRLPAAVLDFAQPQQQIQVEFENIDLGLLLAEHPSSDLSGTGKLSGSIPVTLSEKGVSVTDGLLAANSPGGRLQYHSARAAEMAASSQGMKIITDALDDFHYTLLHSAVTYEDTGKLLLNVRLEGKNPAVENGRPINFNVTLEEDLPAMLASLQLSNQISDVIKKRVQDKMRKKVSP